MHRFLGLFLWSICYYHSALADPQYSDVAAAVGIHFQHRNGAQGNKYLPETMGAGVAFFDYDNDGRQDLYFVNTLGPAALYHNEPDGKFVDTTQEAGVENSGYGMGVGNAGFSTGTAFGDYDNDGDLDLYVANYLDCSSDKPCYRGQDLRVYCAPWSYPTQPDALYRNEANGHFVEVGASVGLVPQQARELGAVFTDYDNDGDLDLFAANGHMDDNVELFGESTYPQQNQLFSNDGPGHGTVRCL
jgi:hypothetical protein